MTEQSEAASPAKKRGLIKLILGIPIALIALLLVGVFVVAIYIDSIAKAGVEQGGTYALGVKTTLSSAGQTPCGRRVAERS